MVIRARPVRHRHDLMVPAFSERDEHVPEVDAAYRFNPSRDAGHPGRLHARTAA
jgi:hypothetical protein